MRSAGLLALGGVASLLLIGSAGLACQPEPDFRSGSGEETSESAAVAGAVQKPGVSISVSQIQALAGQVEVADPLEAYTVAISALAAARDQAGKNVTQALQHLANARAAYEEMFQESAREQDPETDSLITNAFRDSEKAARRGKQSRVGLSEHRIGASLLKIAFMNLEAALNSGDGRQISLWFPVLLNHAEGDGVSHLSPLVAEVTSTPSQPGLASARETVRNDLLNHFAEKVREETVEALVALEGSKTALATEEAVEALMFYRIIQPDLISRLGEQSDRDLMHELNAFLNGSEKGDLEKARNAARELTALLASYLERL